MKSLKSYINESLNESSVKDWAVGTTFDLKGETTGIKSHYDKKFVELYNGETKSISFLDKNAKNIETPDMQKEAGKAERKIKRDADRKNRPMTTRQFQKIMKDSMKQLASDFPEDGMTLDFVSDMAQSIIMDPEIRKYADSKKRFRNDRDAAEWLTGQLEANE